MKKGIFLSISALSAAGLLAALPLSVSAQTEETIRDNSAAETSPANPLNEDGMGDGSVIDVETEGMTEETIRDNAAAETSPANPLNEDGMGGGSVIDVETEGMTEETIRDNAAAETSPANPLNDEDNMMREEDFDSDSDSVMMEEDFDSDSSTYSAPSATPTSTTPSYSNSPRALW